MFSSSSFASVLVLVVYFQQLNAPKALADGDLLLDGEYKEIVQRE
jgi:hypothetical protein